MPMEETNAFSALNQFMIPQNIVSPSKLPDLTNPNKWMEMLMQYSQGNSTNDQQNQLQVPVPTPQQLQQIVQLPQLAQIPQQMPQVPQTQQVVIQTSPIHDSQGDQMLKASPSASSEMSSDSGDVSTEHFMGVRPLQSIDSQVNIAANNLEQKPSLGNHETWMECFTTTKNSEYEALLFSVYVTERAAQKYDGWTHFDCLHRLQSKCRYRVRAKKQDEFYIVEEKGVHNHGAVEPVGQAGSHAGLPKTIREIVDRAYNDSWPLELRAMRVDEEIKRLGLPANPRLGRQIDNRIAYLRRVKNLSESRRIQDQVNFGGPIMPLDSSPHPPSPAIDVALMNPQMLHVLMEQNGGSLTVEKDIVEKLLGPQAVAELAAAQSNLQSSQSQMNQMLEQQQPQNLMPNTVQIPAQHPEVKREDLPMNQEFLEFIQKQTMNPEHEAFLAQLAASGMVPPVMSTVPVPTQENLPQE